MTFAVRAQSGSGDYTFGQGSLNFLRDTPAAVAQAILTRLLLWEGEWWLDLTDGVPYWQDILAQKNYALASDVIRDRILATPFVNSIDDYEAIFDDGARGFTVTGTVNTAFGAIDIDYPIKFTGGGPFNLGTDPVGAGGGGLG